MSSATSATTSATASATSATSATSVTSVSEGISATQFGDEMAEGWADGLKAKFGKDIYVKTKVNVFRTDHSTAGDIDFVFAFNDLGNFKLATILPAGKVSIKPQGSGDAALRKGQTTAVLAELKRSATTKFLDDNVETFVRFYNDFLANTFAPIKDTNLQRVVRSDNMIILYVFNGSDPTNVEATIRRKIQEVCGNPDMRIQGHRVFSLWISSSSLISLAEKVETEKEKVRTDRENRVLKKELEKTTRKNEDLLKKNEDLLQELEQYRAKSGSGGKRPRGTAGKASSAVKRPRRN